MSFVTWATLLGKLPPTAKRARAVDLLVLDQRDPGVAALVESFPLDLVKPSLLYYRTAAGAGTRRHLLSHGYQTSAHHETSAWGENTLAWRADRCQASGMPGRPLWASPSGSQSPAASLRLRCRRCRCAGEDVGAAALVERADSTETDEIFNSESVREAV